MSTDYESWKPYLDPDEVILWQGRPQPGWTWRSGENGTILLGLFVLGFIAFAVTEALSAGQSGPVGGLIIFALIGVIIGASGPVIMGLVQRGTWYTLTDRRALIAHWPMVAGITIYRGVDCYPITEVQLVPADLRGFENVYVSRLSYRYTFHNIWTKVALSGGRVSSGSSSGHRRDPPTGFERICDGAQVAELCRKVQQDRAGQLPDNLRA